MVNWFIRLIYKILYPIAAWLINFLNIPIKGVFIAVWKDDQILIIRNPYKKYPYQFPGGLVDRGESFEIAAVRELWEETGLKITEADLGEFVDLSKFAINRNETTLLCECRLKDEQELKIDYREVDWAEFMLPNEALKLNLQPSLIQYIEERTS